VVERHQKRFKGGQPQGKRQQRDAAQGKARRPPARTGPFALSLHHPQHQPAERQLHQAAAKRQGGNVDGREYGLGPIAI